MGISVSLRLCGDCSRSDSAHGAYVASSSPNHERYREVVLLHASFPLI